jgi:hypothetical protein
MPQNPHSVEYLEMKERISVDATKDETRFGSEEDCLSLELYYEAHYKAGVILLWGLVRLLS